MFTKEMLLGLSLHELASFLGILPEASLIIDGLGIYPTVLLPEIEEDKSFDFDFWF